MRHGGREQRGAHTPRFYIRRQTHSAMEIPSLVRNRLGDEDIETAVSLG
ncbi:MAG: hypothetical protein ACI9CA_001746, partial [Natronomonas sp.]